MNTGLKTSRETFKDKFIHFCHILKFNVFYTCMHLQNLTPEKLQLPHLSVLLILVVNYIQCNNT